MTGRQRRRPRQTRTRREESRGASTRGGGGDFAKKLKIKAEQRAEESKMPGEGMDIDYLDVAREIGAVSLGESDMKFDQAASE